MVQNWARQATRFSVLWALLAFGCGSGTKDPAVEEGADLHGPRDAALAASDLGQEPATPKLYDPAALPLASHLNQKHTDDLKGILERRHIRVLTTFNKTHFFVSGSRVYGFEYSLLKEYDRSLNQGIGRRELKVVMEFIPVPRDQIIPRLVEGLGDIAAAGLTITPERQKQVAFTDPYLTNVDEIVVTNRQALGLGTLEDLSGRNVYVRPSSSYYESLVTLNQEFAKKGIAPIRILKVDESLETEDILEMVHSGAISITVADNILAEIWSGVFDNLKVHTDLRVRTGSEIAWMVRKGNPELKKSLDVFVQRHRKGTRLGNIYFNRYFERNKWIQNPLTTKSLERQRQHTKLFKKYAAEYGFDWLLIMALAYQESGLNNNKVSSSGAVGIMQVRPSTAADRNINIPNVTALEQNVHAGVKYLAFLRDRYFQDERINARNRIRFSLAAYNAGPAKIRRAQRLAQETGWDRYRWFRNVEIATLRLVGQETVQFVSNINKYYVLFKLQQETARLRASSKQESLAKGKPR
jgi:membrane-bound lytic murein transglycosylase MltF